MYQSSKKIHSTYEESHTGDGVYWDDNRSYRKSSFLFI